MRAANVHAMPWVDFGTRITVPDGTKPPTPATGVSLRWQPHPQGPHLVVTPGDLTDARVDAIVSAAGSHLTYDSGVGAAILAKAGPDLASECQAWIEDHHRLPVGQAMVTSAGNLPCSCVIHAVGPVAYSAQSTPKATRQLRDAVRSALFQADRLQLTSVAMPGISTCKNGYPTKLAAREMVSECAEYAIENASVTTLKTIVFMGIDTPTYRKFLKALVSAQQNIGCGSTIEKTGGPIKEFRDQSTLTKLARLCPRSLTATPFEFLSPDHADYKRILAELRYCRGCRVESVRRVQAPARELAYEAMKTTLKKGLVKEVETLYHETSDRWRASAIARNGFDLSITQNGRMYGHGAYTSTDAAVALKYTFERGSLLQLRGLVSNTTIINGDVHVFPNPAALLSVTIVDIDEEDEDEDEDEE